MDNELKLESEKSIIFTFSLCRRFKGGMLEAHPREKSIIVNYKLEAAVYGDGDVVDPMLADKKVCKQILFDWQQQQNVCQGL